MILIVVASSCATSSTPMVKLVTSGRPPKAAVPFPVAIVELNGTGSEMGAEQGKKLGGEIHFLFDHYLKPYFSSEMERFLALTAAAGFEERISVEHREEVIALAKATQLPEREIMLAQCFLDLSPMTACWSITLPGSSAPE